MSETEPKQTSLAVFREVHGVDRTHIRSLRARLKEHGVGQDLGRRIITRPNNFRIYLLMQDELRDFYDDQAVTATDKMVEVLSERLTRRLKQAVNPRERVPLLPATIHPPDSESPRQSLMVAHSQAALQQRDIVKAFVPVFFDRKPEDVSEGVWFEDEFVTGTVLARSRGDIQLEGVRNIEELLREEGQALTAEKIIPAMVGIGRAQTEIDYGL